MIVIHAVYLLTETFKIYSWHCTDMLSLVFLVTLNNYFYVNSHQTVCLARQS